jgi:hypothetical protein
MGFFKLDEIYILLIIVGLDEYLHRILIATAYTVILVLLTLYFISRGEIEINFGKPCDTSDCRIIIAGKTFNLTLDAIDQFIRDWNHIQQNEMGPERAFATYHVVLDRAPSLLLNAAPHYTSLRQRGCHMG